LAWLGTPPGGLRAGGVERRGALYDAIAAYLALIEPTKRVFYRC